MHLVCQLIVSKYCESFLMPSVWELESPSQACSSDGFCLFAFLLTFQEQINTLFLQKWERARKVFRVAWDSQGSGPAGFTGS